MKLNPLIQSLVAAGLAISISLPAWADPSDSNQRLTPAERSVMREKWQNMTPEQRSERRQSMREHWKNMPPEERRDLREKMRDRWEKMSPEDREARRGEMRQRWEKMSPEDREQFRNDLGGSTRGRPDSRPR